MSHLWSVALQLPGTASEVVRPYLSPIAVAITSTLLAIFGGDINGWMKEAVKPYPFVVRVACFVLLVAFGYGAVTLLIAHLFARVLASVNNSYLAVLIALTFIVIGMLAEHKRHI